MHKQALIGIAEWAEINDYEIIGLDEDDCGVKIHFFKQEARE